MGVCRQFRHLDPLDDRDSLQVRIVEPMVASGG
jgi:hypothetical protein